ncbi:MAG TPA: DUF4440 domain-containing protein [Gemmatimonadaceae bacterium]|nr:DUF4440 domain-containing protein [Gemmatimonadaceae bacterium]
MSATPRDMDITANKMNAKANETDFVRSDAVEPTDDIADLHREWVDNVARGNAEGLRDLVTEDYEVWPDGALSLTGRDVVVSSMAGAIALYQVEQVFDSVELVVTGDWAFERGIERITVTQRSGGAAQSRTQRVLLILRRGADGRWRYARGITNNLPSVPAPPA